MQGIAIAAHAVGATQVYLYLHPEASEARAAAERAIGAMGAELGVPIEVALGPGGFMGGEESALLAVLESMDNGKSIRETRDIDVPLTLDIDEEVLPSIDIARGRDHGTEGRLVGLAVQRRHELERAAEAIGRARSVALACHVAPDGDALGSLLALHHLCRSQGKASVASWPEPFEVAAHYTFLPGLDSATKPADFPAALEIEYIRVWQRAGEVHGG